MGGAAGRGNLYFFFSEVHWKEIEEDPIQSPSPSSTHIVLLSGEKFKAEHFVPRLRHFNSSGPGKKRKEE